jgi:lambda family phage portal protein
MKWWPSRKPAALPALPAPAAVVPQVVGERVQQVTVQRMRPMQRPDPLVDVLNQRAYSAAELTRLTSDWSVSYASSNDELRRALPVLRAAARHHERNSDLFRRYLSLLDSNVIHDGYALQPTPRFPSGQLDRGAAKAIADAWWKWASLPVTLDGRLTFAQVERLVLRTLARDGEVLVKIHYRAGQLRLEVLEADHMPVEIHRAYGDSVLGVQLDGDRRPTGYWLTRDHPGDSLASSGGYTIRHAEFTPADRVLHIFRSERPGQVRGVPWGSSVFDKLLMLQGYEIAELAAARMDAARPAAVERAVGAIGAQYRGDGGREDPEVNLEPGGITILGEGETMNWNPGNHPSGTFAPFVSEIKRDIAAGLQVSYHALNSDLGAANYSSLKHGRADEVRAYRVVQDLLGYQFHSPVFRRWLEVYLMSDTNPFPFSKLEKFSAHEWRKPAFEPVDDLKEADKAARELELGLTTHSDILAERGKDFVELVERIAADRALLKSKGITLGKVEEQAAAEAAEAEAPEQGAQADEPAPDAGTVEQDAVNASALALNGVQVTAMLAVLEQVSTGKIPKEVGKVVLTTSFAMSTESAAAMVDPLELREPDPPPAPFGGKPPGGKPGAPAGDKAAAPDEGNSDE